ncbi:MAG: carbohydrate ABC transporter permease [Pleurocapsa minor GSE-CHR-MK-17-07R]|jgi:multiple sugar transport system permease protein|nr:carbohydrate ABC transporter permease [Pleurocapsa minor GSE-CHR-MK 17-07R]
MTTLTRPSLNAHAHNHQARRQKQLGMGAVYALLIIGSLIFMMPLIIMVATSFKSFSEINTYPPTILPNVWLPENYANAWNYQNTNFTRWTFNTLLIIAATLPGVILTSSLCAYGFARLEFPGRKVWFGLVLASVMLPPQVTLIPLYILFYNLGWLNTFYPLIIPAWFGGGALNIFLLRQFYMQIPRELDEAATLDGASHFTIWWRIYMPLSRPALISVTFLTVLGIWNDFLGPLIYLTSPENYTLALGLNMFQGLFITRTDYIMAISTLMVLPMIVMFIVAQRYVVQGFVTSGLKG